MNKFYSILFEFLKDEVKKDDYNFIPNENGLYKPLNKVYENKDIDEDIKEILILLNSKKDFNNQLIHKKIKLGIQHQQKTLEDIAGIIDFEFQKYYINIENNNNINIQFHEIK